MNEEIYVAYLTDPWYSYSSFRCMGAYSTLDNAVDAILKHLWKNIPLTYYCEIKDTAREELQDILQTQCCSEYLDGEYYISPLTLDEYEEP